MKKPLKLLLTAAAFAGAGVLFVTAPGPAAKKQRAPFQNRNFAHRGLHSPDRSVPENSREAFRLAAEAGYGMELDVQLSKDGQVVVFHDDTLNRVCGVDDRVENRTWEELSQMRLCGTEETIPLFSEVLEIIGGRGPLITELKNGRRNRELCEKTLALLEAYPGEVCIESFNPLIVAWFRFHAPRLLRGQLACPQKKYTDMPKWESFVLSHCLMNPLARPQFIAYEIGGQPWTVRLSRLLGCMNVGWTSHEVRSEEGRDAVIFEFYRPELRYSPKSGRKRSKI